MSNTTQNMIAGDTETEECRRQSQVRRRMFRWFSDFAGWSALMIGSASAFVVATISVIVWAATGPLFHYSDTWQLVINTGTTLVTFLAVFLIQHSQNRDGQAIQLKLDELIRSTEQARNKLIDLEHCTDEELESIQKEFARRRSS
ncbi:MAG TPA: low affinity iron permease family protein [Hyphomicrobium sp.]|nr:low affinity iron permease family protein [Hyphomicrobium sp.]